MYSTGQTLTVNFVEIMKTKEGMNGINQSSQGQRAVVKMMAATTTRSSGRPTT
jgi:hypothetical protein